MKKILFTSAMFLLMPLVSFAQTGSINTVGTNLATNKTAIADPGLVPGDFFYFLDRWSETLSTAFTFNKEKKARKHLEYAKERVSEMGEVLKNPEAKLEDIRGVRSDFDRRVAEAVALVNGLSSLQPRSGGSSADSGSDVAKLARELDDELDASRDALKDIFEEHKDRSSRAEEEILAKLADLPADAPQVQGLKQALESITKEKDDAMEEEDELDIDFLDEQALFEEIMGDEMVAEKHIEQVMRIHDRFEGVAGKGWAPPQTSEQLIGQAKEAMKRGDFETAKRMSKDAERIFENAEEMRGILEGGPFEGGSEVEFDDDMDIGELDGLLLDDGLGGVENEMEKSERMMEDFSR